MHQRTRATRPSWKNERTTRGDVRKTKWRRLRRRSGIERGPRRLFAFSSPAPVLHLARPPLTHRPPRPSGPRTATTPRCAPSTYIPPRHQSLALLLALFLHLVLHQARLRRFCLLQPLSQRLVPWPFAFLRFNTFLNERKNKYRVLIGSRSRRWSASPILHRRRPPTSI